MSKKQITVTAFKQARENGMTVKELSTHFGISQANVKEIIGKLELPKRARRVGYELLDNENTTQPVSNTNTQEA
jgi:predicted transcriptional regulator